MIIIVMFYLLTTFIIEWIVLKLTIQIVKNNDLKYETYYTYLKIKI